MLGIKKKLETQCVAYLRIKALPNSAKTGFKEIMEMPEGTTIKMSVKAAAEKGKANIEIEQFLCSYFNSKTVIISGFTSRIKLVQLQK